MIVGAIIYGLTSDRYLQKKFRITGEMKPEYRLPPLLWGGPATPLGLFLYGWTAHHRIHWIVPLISTTFVGLGMMLSILPVENYLVDAFPEHAASATAGGVFFRAILGAVVPLAGPPLNAALGLGWANSVLGFTAIAFMAIPMLFVWRGEWIRKHPRFQIAL